MVFYYMLVIGSIVLLGGSAVYALYWAAGNGQFSNMEDGSKVIFGDDEPIGKVTDLFPGMDLEKEKAKVLARKKKKA